MNHVSKLISAALVATTLSLGTVQAADSADASALFSEGVALMKQGKLDAAREKLERSLALNRRPSAVLNLAHVERNANRHLQALKLYREYASMPGTKPELVTEAKTNIAKLYAVTGHLRVRGPEGADVKIDADKLGRLPIADELDVSAGVHTVTVAGVAKSVSCEAGKSAEVTFDAPPPAASTSVVVVPPASTAPPAATGPVFGHEPPPKDPELEDRRSVMGWVVPGVLVAAGIGVATTGLVIRLGAASTGDEARAAAAGQDCRGSTTAGCVRAQELAESEKNQKNLGVGLLVGGGAALVGGVVSFLVWPSDRVPKRGLRIQPSVGVGQLQLVGTF
ncbi:MAG: hypothetical protein HOO96_26980 [Polyangiaceae bacterium]|nr:hypothetical protein [Polyangiaceae bacterium]